MNPTISKLHGWLAILFPIFVSAAILLGGFYLGRTTREPVRLWLSITPNSVTIQRLRENTPPDIIFNHPVPTKGAIGKALDLRP